MLEKETLVIQLTVPILFMENFSLTSRRGSVILPLQHSFTSVLMGIYFFA